MMQQRYEADQGVYVGFTEILQKLDPVNPNMLQILEDSRPQNLSTAETPRSQWRDHKVNQRPIIN